MIKDLPEDFEHPNCCQNLRGCLSSSRGGGSVEAAKKCIWLGQLLSFKRHSQALKEREQKADQRAGEESAGKEFVATGSSMVCHKTDCSSVVSVLNPRKGQLQHTVILWCKTSGGLKRTKGNLSFPAIVKNNCRDQAFIPFLLLPEIPRFHLFES